MAAEDTRSQTQPHRRGAVAVIQREERFLVIKRSQHVAAPGKLCFPGGGIEADESESEAVVREIQEELGARIEPSHKVWENVTSWGVHLVWWQAKILAEEEPQPNPAEVESVHWFSPDEMLALEHLLESARHFLHALERGEIDLR